MYSPSIYYFYVSLFFTLCLCFVDLQVLCSWLSNSPNYEEITKWYLGWKSIFSDVLLTQPLIKEKFNEALDIMNRAVSSGMGMYHTKSKKAVLKNIKQHSFMKNINQFRI